jgi:hypothetical protein
MDVHNPQSKPSEYLGVISAGSVCVTGIEEEPDLLSGRFAESVDIFGS